MTPIVIFDGQYMLWRYIHIGNKIGVLDTDTICSRYLSAVLNLSVKFDSSDIVVLWDDGTPKWRKELLPEYKSSRVPLDIEDPVSKAFLECKSKLKSVILNIGIMSFGLYGYEADDIAFLLSRVYPSTILISDDRDWFLSVNNTTSVFRPIKEELIDMKWMSSFMEEKEKPIERYLWYKAILGDGSDDIKGVIGIGPASALKYSKSLTYNTSIDDTTRGCLVKDNIDKIKSNLSVMDLSWVINSTELIEEYARALQSRLVFPANEIEFIVRLNGIKNQVKNWDRWKKLFSNITFPMPDWEKLCQTKI